VRGWYALFEARCRRWYGVTRHDRWGMLGGQLVTPILRTRPPFWVWNAALHQLYLSSYHLAPRFAPHYLAALERHDVRYLWGYPSALVALAEAALDAGWRAPPLAAAITNAEPLDAAQRATIGAAFGCPVRETYGMAELVAAASECTAGRLHLWPEVGAVEVHDDDGRPAPAGTVGSLVCTGLLNEDMPLVRYAVGDRGALAAPDAAPNATPNAAPDAAAGATACACGRALPILAAVDGRDDDVLYTRDGRRVGRLDPVFKARLRIRGAQLEQASLDRLLVRYVPAPGFTPSDADAIAGRLRERLGDVAVAFEAVETLPRTANGKVRGVICRIPRDQRPTGRGACDSPS
jgi:phenylacetate-CoA ligase